MTRHTPSSSPGSARRTPTSPWCCTTSAASRTPRGRPADGEAAARAAVSIRAAALGDEHPATAADRAALAAILDATGRHDEAAQAPRARARRLRARARRRASRSRGHARQPRQRSTLSAGPRVRRAAPTTRARDQAAHARRDHLELVPTLGHARLRMPAQRQRQRRPQALSSEHATARASGARRPSPQAHLSGVRRLEPSCVRAADGDLPADRADQLGMAVRELGGRRLMRSDGRQATARTSAIHAPERHAYRRRAYLPSVSISPGGASATHNATRPPSRATAQTSRADALQLAFLTSDAGRWLGRRLTRCRVSSQAIASRGRPEVRDRGHAATRDERCSARVDARIAACRPGRPSGYTRRSTLVRRRCRQRERQRLAVCAGP